MDKPEMKKYAGDTFCTVKFDYTAMTECSAEVTMPDYYPEVRRIVSAFAEVLPDSKYLSEGNLEYGGTVSFSVLYIGDDNSLCCVPYSSEYSDSVQLPSEVEGSACVKIVSKAENTQCRVTAPRKISLKTRVKSQIMSDGRENYSCVQKTASGEPYFGGSLEYLDRTVNTVFRKWGTGTGSCTGEIPDAAGSKPVMCSGSINITSATAGRDCVTVKGSACVRCIVFNTDGVYSTVTGSLPFEETVNMEGTAEGDRVSAFGRAASVSVSTDGAAASAEVEYDLDVTACRPSLVCVTDDIYSTVSQLELERGQTEPICLLACHNGQFTVNGEIKRSGDKKGDSCIVTACAEPVFEKAEIKDGRLILSGNMRAKVFEAADGDINCEEGTLPLKYEIPAEGDAAPQEVLWNADASVIKLSAKDMGDKINFTAELCTAVEAVRKYRITPVTEARFSGEGLSEGAGCVIKICCPEKGTPVWEIAKKHHAAIPELERINGIRRDSVSDGSPLIIK
ncbi:MAG: DUF3794 domain-containing protein [Clostridia bacterium]|nr:DUF3794 domain-containing protein [Clostridia bacterium]